MTDVNRYKPLSKKQKIRANKKKSLDDMQRVRGRYDVVKEISHAHKRCEVFSQDHVVD